MDAESTEIPSLLQRRSSGIIETMSEALRPERKRTAVIERRGLHEDSGDSRYWLSKTPLERIAAVETLSQ